MYFILRETIWLGVGTKLPNEEAPSQMTRTLAAAALLGAISATPVAAAAPAAQAATPAPTPVTLAQVEAAQRAWGDALLRISATKREHGAERGRAAAAEVIDQLYAFDRGPVLFKPTLTTAPQTFRTTRAGAKAYFAGGDAAFPSDNGFAFNDWRAVAIENASVHINGDMALSMGNVRLTNGAGQVTTVDKTWGFQRDTQGQLRIVLHHSSLPFAP